MASPVYYIQRTRQWRHRSTIYSGLGNGVTDLLYTTNSAMASPVYYIQRTRQWRNRSTIYSGLGNGVTGLLYTDHADYWKGVVDKCPKLAQNCEKSVYTSLAWICSSRRAFDHVVCLSLLQQGGQRTRNIYECSAAEYPSQRNAATWTLSGS